MSSYGMNPNGARGADNEKQEFNLYSRRSCRNGIDRRGGNRRGGCKLMDADREPVLARNFCRGPDGGGAGTGGGMVRRMGAP